MDEIKKRFLSKKFALAISGFIYFALQGDFEGVRKVVETYLLAEGFVDVVDRFRK